MTLVINDIQHNDTQHTTIECCYADRRYAECCNCLNVTLSVIMLNVFILNLMLLNVVILSVVVLGVVMLSVVAPCLTTFFVTECGTN